MSRRRENEKTRLINQVAVLLGEKHPQESGLETFVRDYYALVAPEDILDLSPENLLGVALAHWDLAGTRRGKARKLRVYNPIPEKDGWKSTRTVVQIVSPDMPFLVDSTRMELNRHGFTIHLIVHPVIWLRRNKRGSVIGLAEKPDGNGQGKAESFIHAEVNRETNGKLLASLNSDLNRVLDDVNMAVEDWPKTKDRVRDTLRTLVAESGPVPESEVSEARSFIEWLQKGNFTFLGYREHELVRRRGVHQLRIAPGTGLGILRERHARKLARSFIEIPAGMRKVAYAKVPLVLTKSNSLATVHRPVRLDYVGIKRFDAKGEVCGERRILGLYTSAAYQTDPTQIPVVRRKITIVMKRTGFAPDGHAGKALLDILKTYPRDELFQISEDDLYEFAMGILHLQERQAVRLFVRKDPFGRLFSCLVFVPRDHFDTALRQRIQAILTDGLNGEDAEFTVSLSESVLARIHFIIHTKPTEIPEVDVEALQEAITTVVRSWQDQIQRCLIEEHGEEAGHDLFKRYTKAFPAAYREDTDVGPTVFDIDKVETALRESDVQAELYFRVKDPDGVLRFKLYRPNEPIPLSSVVPMLENMGVFVISESPYKIRPAGSSPVSIQDFTLRHNEGDWINVARIKDIFARVFVNVWEGKVENDGFNRLVLRAGLGMRDIVFLRTCSKYLRQTGITFSQSYMEEALANNAELARMLVELFRTRFDPAPQNHAATRGARLAAEIQDRLDAVESLDEDRILRRFFGVIQAIIRTNFFQLDEDGHHKDYLSLKLAPALIPELPLPRPMFEIFVYSARVEGIHLRGGKVARGGLRWSDRREDFRKEVLGLMKAQMVKNTVIVPMGAKGGFVVKQPPLDSDREALQEEGIRCYRTFVRGLLDLTDNRVGNRIKPPVQVIRYDEDDPYLVVAADKGTAAFSDIANEISNDYRFWLGDAFASGGSSGYDHKVMGITAKGAWESVKQHFRAIRIDIQQSDFTVVGIGDMAGDVFGNGMLLSQHIKLIGAFNHQHIFLDPNPDSAISFRERKRLFERPRSTWMDYHPKLISKGGGVFERRAKSIALSPSVRDVLDIKANKLSPDELIRALLRAPVDLVWNGGIGTYVKSTLEGHIDVGDRSNDAVRVNAAELRCKVIGEGGNLGLTQAGRIQFAQRSGHVNTDFIDNSGGVDCSDREVNIKIPLNVACGAGRLKKRQRDRLLKRMTTEVENYVLLDNYRQARAISVAEAKSKTHPDWFRRTIDNLHRSGLFDRDREDLPDDNELDRRIGQGEGLYRPEIAVLLAYVKIDLFHKVLASDMPDDPYLGELLHRYFPAPMRKRFASEIGRHRLRREISTTVATNSMVNRAGITFAHRLQEDTGFSIPEIARAYMIARDVFDVRTLWDDIDTLDHVLAYELQNTLIIETQHVLARAARWFLRGGHHKRDITVAIKNYQPMVAKISKLLTNVISGIEKGSIDAKRSAYVEQGVGDPLATKIATLDIVVSTLDIGETARLSKTPFEVVAQTYFRLGERLHAERLRQKAALLPDGDQWHERARTAIIDELYQIQAGLTAEVIRGGRKPDVDQWIHDWSTKRGDTLERYRRLTSAALDSETPTSAMFTVVLGELRKLHLGRHGSSSY